VLTFAGFHWIGLILAAQQWDFLRTIGAQGSLLAGSLPAYQIARSLAWGLAGSVTGWGLWRGLHWAPGGLGGLLLAYSVYYWVDRLWVSAVGAGDSWPFWAISNAILLMLVWASLRRKPVRLYFGERYEQSIQDPGTS
jgi:hypothetical protein